MYKYINRVFVRLYQRIGNTEYEESQIVSKREVDFIPWKRLCRQLLSRYILPIEPSIDLIVKIKLSSSCLRR